MLMLTNITGLVDNLGHMAGAPIKNMILAKADDILERIAGGETQAEIAEDLKVSPGFLCKVLRLTPEMTARAREARLDSAEALYDRAHSELKGLTSAGTQADIARARELAQHYRRMAAVRNPREYGDKIDISGNITHEHTVSGLLSSLIVSPLLPSRQPLITAEDADYEPI